MNDDEQSIAELQEAGDLWATLRAHSDDYVPSWCPTDKRHNCGRAELARDQLRNMGMLDGRP